MLYIFYHALSISEESTTSETWKSVIEITGIKMTLLKQFSFLIFYGILIKWGFVFVFVLYTEQNYLARDLS